MSCAGSDTWYQLFIAALVAWTWWMNGNTVSSFGIIKPNIIFLCFFPWADPPAVHWEPWSVYAPPAGGLAGGPADEGSGQRREGQKTGREWKEECLPSFRSHGNGFVSPERAPNVCRSGGEAASAKREAAAGGGWEGQGQAGEAVDPVTGWGSHGQRGIGKIHSAHFKIHFQKDVFRSHAYISWQI